MYSYPFRRSREDRSLPCRTTCMPNPRRQRSFWARIKPFNSFYTRLVWIKDSKKFSFDRGRTSGQRSPQFKNESQYLLASKVKISKILTVLRLVRDEAHTVWTSLPDCQISFTGSILSYSRKLSSQKFYLFSTQIFKTPLEVLKKTRRYLLSRFHNYHRLQALSFRIRDGNGRFHLDMVAGRLPTQFSPNRQFPFYKSARVASNSRNNRSTRSNVRPLVPVSWTHYWAYTSGLSTA